MYNIKLKDFNSKIKIEAAIKKIAILQNNHQ